MATEAPEERILCREKSTVQASIVFMQFISILSKQTIKWQKHS